MLKPAFSLLVCSVKDGDAILQSLVPAEEALAILKLCEVQYMGVPKKPKRFYVASIPEALEPYIHPI